MEYCFFKLVVYWFCIYKVMLVVVIGDNKRFYEFYLYIKNFYKYDVY